MENATGEGGRIPLLLHLGVGLLLLLGNGVQPCWRYLTAGGFLCSSCCWYCYFDTGHLLIFSPRGSVDNRQIRSRRPPRCWRWNVQASMWTKPPPSLCPFILRPLTHLTALSTAKPSSTDDLCSLSITSMFLLVMARMMAKVNIKMWQYQPLGCMTPGATAFFVPLSCQSLVPVIL